jgi:hypothetical protein
MKRVALLLFTACAGSAKPFPLRDPLAVDPDTKDVSVSCRPDPAKDDKNRQSCTPVEYVSPFIWDQVDNVMFARISRGLSVDVSGESRNVNSMDEVADSSWYTNRAKGDAGHDEAPGACKAEDMLPEPADVKDGEWLIDHGKDNGSTLGFRINIKGLGKYMLKADDTGLPERASAASVIGAAIYDELGFNTSCEQVVTLKKSQLKLKPDLVVFDNEGLSHPFDDAALDKVLASTTQLPGGLVRMQASKWLPGVTLGPFRYIGVRKDDPNDVVDHYDRRELRAGQVLAAWLDHWDAREQNSMDVWMSNNAKDTRSSPGHMVHYILDTSDTMGGEVGIDEMSRRLGHSYNFDFVDVFRSLLTFGIEEYPWDRATKAEDKKKFGYFSNREFHPDTWKPLYPNPAFLRMTEHDAAWMARKIARFSKADIQRIIELGRWKDPSDVAYLVNMLTERQAIILERYFSKLSPIGDVRAEGDKICATDFSRKRELYVPTAYRYRATERSDHEAVELSIAPGEEGELCFQPKSIANQGTAENDPRRVVTIEIANGTHAGPLVIHTYDLGPKGFKVVGVTRPRD